MANRKSSARRKAKRRKLRPASPPAGVDERRSHVRWATAANDVPFVEPLIVVKAEPVRLESGDDLFFQSPVVVNTYLTKAKRLRDVAEPRRAAAIKNIESLDDGTLRPRDPTGVFKALEDLALAVIVAAAAIEAHANDMIWRLPEDAMVEIPTRLAGTTVPVMRDKAAMDRLSIGDKLGRAAPLLDGAESIKGTVAWQKYKRLFRMRNALVHPRRERVELLKPSVFGKLLLGEGSFAPEDAAAVIEALEPGWIKEPVRSELGL